MQTMQEDAVIYLGVYKVLQTDMQYRRIYSRQMKKSKRVEVAVRMRPMLYEDEDTAVWQVNEESHRVISLPKSLRNNTSILNEDSVISHNKRKASKIEQSNVYEFVYDHAFKDSADNKKVYEDSCRDAVDEFARGGMATIFMYGQTTSGKTYTMLGPNGREGVVSYALQDIFKKSKAKTINVSYLEIYNQQMRDLLSEESSPLRISEEGVQGLHKFTLRTVEQGLLQLQKGEKQRAYSEKSYHDHSSRSHTVFQIYNATGVLNLVDLAGSERLGEEECSEETAYINKSLFVLSNVIQKLASPKRNAHIPFRDSKLTRLLAPALTNSRATVIICTISPADINFAQTLSTLRFAALSRKIELKAHEEAPADQSDIKKHLDAMLLENQTLKQAIHKSKQGYLEQMIEKMEKAVEAGSVEMKEWRGKAMNLNHEFKANVQILEEEYRKAFINLTHNQLGLDKEGVSRVLM